MIRVDTTRVAPGCLLALAIVFPGSIHAESLVCKAEQASGFVYDPESRQWIASAFSIETRKYRVAPVNEDNIFARALKYDYEIRDASSAKPVIHCKSVKLPDSNEETGLIMCRGSFGASFNIDTRTGRYIRAQPTGYVAQQTSTGGEETPYMEIGHCRQE